MNTRGQNRAYWKVYGGWHALLTSKFLWIALVVSLLSYSVWMKDGWWAVVIEILPSIVGFSLGGFAIFLGLGDAKFRGVFLGEEGSGHPSPFMSACAAFTHFLILQFTALLLALFLSSRPLGAIYSLLNWEPEECIAWVTEGLKLFFWWFCYFLFIYSILAAIGAVLRVYDVAKKQDDFETRLKEIKKKQEQSQQSN